MVQGREADLSLLIAVRWHHITSCLPTLRELSRGGSNQNAECGHIYEHSVCHCHTSEGLTIVKSLPLIFRREGL